MIGLREKHVLINAFLGNSESMDACWMQVRERKRRPRRRRVQRKKKRRRKRQGMEIEEDVVGCRVYGEEGRHG